MPANASDFHTVPKFVAAYRMGTYQQIVSKTEDRQTGGGILRIT